MAIITVNLAVIRWTPTHIRLGKCALFGILNAYKPLLSSTAYSKRGGKMFKLLLLLVVCQVLPGSLVDAATANGNDSGTGEEEDKCNTHEPFNSNVHIARLEFERVQTIFIVAVFILVVILAKLGELQFRPLSKMHFE